MTINVSASSLSDFVACSQRVYYRIFEAGEAIPSREMLMGSITHKVLEKHWNSLEDAQVAVVKLSSGSGLDLVAIESIHHFVNTYFDKFRMMVTDDDKIEKRFKVKLYDDVYLVGVFDRVTRGTVIDWKTNASPPKRLENNIQFILYDMAYTLLYNKKAEGLYLASLKDGSLVRYKESKLHSEEVVKNIIPQFVETVRKKTFVKSGLFNGSCYRCPFKADCIGDWWRNSVVDN